jgi:hypothetical protein
MNLFTHVAAICMKNRTLSYVLIHILFDFRLHKSLDNKITSEYKLDGLRKNTADVEQVSHQ